MFTPDDEEQLLLETYPVPTADKVASLSESQSLLEAAATRENYREWMHNLLYIEEIAQFSSIAKSVYKYSALYNSSMLRSLCKPDHEVIAIHISSLLISGNTHQIMYW